MQTLCGKEILAEIVYDHVQPYPSARLHPSQVQPQPPHFPCSGGQGNSAAQDARTPEGEGVPSTILARRQTDIALHEKFFMPLTDVPEEIPKSLYVVAEHEVRRKCIWQKHVRAHCHVESPMQHVTVIGLLTARHGHKPCLSILGSSE